MQELRTNVLLATLPDEEFHAVAERVEVLDADIREEVYEPGSPILDVYFPLTSVFSLVGLAEGERVQVEVATIGKEGMVGLPLFLGATSSPQGSFCQVPGRAARMGGEDFRRVLRHDGALHRLLNRYTQTTMVQISQNVVCNSTHSAEQRACRWLLTTADRVGRERYSLTQEFLAQMLGVRRPTVSEVAGDLQDRGLISYTRGTMTLLDRERLEKSACGCYEVITGEFEQLARGD
jgi:CRP-like cAMP-binding protein